MGTAFNPGLVVLKDTLIRRVRRLPIKGEVLVKPQEVVDPQTVVARAWLPGDLQTVKVNETLGIEPFEVEPLLKVKEGERVTKQQVLAETKIFFGLFTSRCHAPFDGTVEYYSKVTGHLGIRKAPTPIEVDAYLRGWVVEVSEGESATIQTRGALVQGIFGVGGERSGTLKCVANAADEELNQLAAEGDLRGTILVAGSLVTSEFLKQAAERGVVGVVVGGIIDRDLAVFVGRDLGVAVTGHEKIPLTLVMTEGFGKIAMALRTFEMLKSLEGRLASLNGTTQIRAGAVRPEIIVPSTDGPEGETVGKKPSPSKGSAWMLDEGTRVRMIRTPYFGLLGTVTGLPEEPRKIDTGSYTRVLVAQLDDGRTVTVPRANVEIIS